MPESKQILTFTLRNERFAVDATAVKEIVQLPELTPVEEAPPYIVGVFNLRGHIVPVMDLNVRLGHKQERYSVSDRVVIIDVGATTPAPPYQGGDQGEVIIEGGFGVFGVIVNDVHDVVTVSPTDIEPSPQQYFIEGEAKVGEEIVMLLNYSNMISSIGGTAVSAVLTGGTPVPPKLSPEELDVFHSRSLALMQPTESLTLAGLTPLAVVGLNGEYYGVELETVREFSDIGIVTPVPCTPRHIVGDMNLRGDILTLVDIRGMLNGREFSPLPQGEGGGKVIVAQINDLLAGVTVDEVFEVVYLGPSDRRPVPSAVKAGNEFISGEAPFAGKMLSILDLKKILTREELVVNEETSNFI